MVRLPEEEGPSSKSELPSTTLTRVTGSPKLAATARPQESDEEDDPDLPDDPDASDEAPETAAYIGLHLESRDGRTVVKSVLSDGPAYTAGVLAGDEIVAMNRRRLPADQLRARLRRRGPGETVSLHLLRRDELKELAVTLAARLDRKWVVRRVEEPSPAQRAVYESWIGQPWPADEP